MKFATRYAPPPSVGLEFREPSMTEQHFRDECDINHIVAQYEATGVIPQGTRQPLFGDFADFPQDLMASQKFFDDAHERFMQLPSELRKKFGNNPANLLTWLRDPANTDDAVKYGLLERVEPTPNPQYQSMSRAKPQGAQSAPNSTPPVQSQESNVSS